MGVSKKMGIFGWQSFFKCTYPNCKGGSGPAHGPGLYGSTRNSVGSRRGRSTILHHPTTEPTGTTCHPTTPGQAWGSTSVSVFLRECEPGFYFWLDLGERGGWVGGRVGLWLGSFHMFLRQEVKHFLAKRCNFLKPRKKGGTVKNGM